MELIYDTVREGSLFSFFLACAVLDFRCRKVPNWLLGAAAAGRFLFCLPEWFLLGAAEAPRQLLLSAAGSAVLTAALFLAVFFHRGGLGMGDIKFAGTAALFMEMERLLETLLWGFVLAGICLLLAPGRKRERKLPMIPFFLGGFLLERLT